MTNDTQLRYAELEQADTDSLYNMKEGSVLNTGLYEILRVPGGWIYSRFEETGTGGYSISSCFVPFNNEFQPSR